MSYDPSIDMAGFVRVYNDYMMAVANSYRPKIDEAIRLAQELEDRAARARAHWQRMKDQQK